VIDVCAGGGGFLPETAPPGSPDGLDDDAHCATTIESLCVTPRDPSRFLLGCVVTVAEAGSPWVPVAALVRSYR
jgi:hypothetical protein